MADDDQPTTTEPAAPPSAAAPPSGTALTESLRQAFAQYLAERGIQPGEGGDVRVDLDFLREHAGPMIVQLLRGATQSLMPRELKLRLDAPGATPGEGEGEAKPAGPALTFDLGDLLARLLTPPPRP